MKLEPARLAAAARCPDKGALAAVARPDRALHRRRDRPRGARAGAVRPRVPATRRAPPDSPGAAGDRRPPGVPRDARSGATMSETSCRARDRRARARRRPPGGHRRRSRGTASERPLKVVKGRGGFIFRAPCPGSQARGLRHASWRPAPPFPGGAGASASASAAADPPKRPGAGGPACLITERTTPSPTSARGSRSPGRPGPSPRPARARMRDPTHRAQRRSPPPASSEPAPWSQSVPGFPGTAVSHRAAEAAQLHGWDHAGPYVGPVASQPRSM